MDTIRLIIRIIVSFSMFCVLLFWPAGRLDIPSFWTYIITMLLFSIIGLLVLPADLINERRKPGPGGKGLVIIFLFVPIVLGHFIIAGFDVGRYHWSDFIPPWLQVISLILVALSLSLNLWSMYANKFFSSVIRIQEDRGHYLVENGPYKVIRHPGYLAIIFCLLSSGPALGSLWSGALFLPGILLIILRLFSEEKLLRKELEGYEEYMRKVRFRLIPGLW